MQGKLSIVGTPIGNLGDITLRALETLNAADVVYCEDTRVSKRLFDRHGIESPLRLLDANIEEERAKEIVDRLTAGEQVALITDAGTPGIADPGYRLVRIVRQALGNSFPIVAIPGPSAVAAALSISGAPADEFLFLGFLPHKKGRQTLLKEIAETKRTVVLYESPHRILKLLREISEHVPSREVAVVREVTKAFEDVQIGAPADIAAHLEEAGQDRGEFVVIIAAA